MKKKASFFVESYYKNNIVFNDKLNVSKFEGRTYKHIKLKESFERFGIDLSTQDINSVNDSDIVIYNDMPDKFPSDHNKNKSYLIIYEPPSVLTRNFNLDLYENFIKIFTWDDSLVNNKNIFKFNFSFDLKSNYKKNLDFLSRKFVCMIAANKFSFHEKEAYTSRLKIINWYLQNEKEFHLYGFNWDKTLFKNYPFTYLNRFNLPFPNSFIKNLQLQKIYKGSINSKFDVLGDYKFCFCFENIYDIEGYITEKIFDCFFSLTVPIYLGANNIDFFIPKNTFIDFRDFNSIEELHNYIYSMKKDKRYRQGILKPNNNKKYIGKGDPVYR